MISPPPNHNVNRGDWFTLEGEELALIGMGIFNTINTIWLKATGMWPAKYCRHTFVIQLLWNNPLRANSEKSSHYSKKALLVARSHEVLIWGPSCRHYYFDKGLHYLVLLCIEKTYLNPPSAMKAWQSFSLLYFNLWTAPRVINWFNKKSSIQITCI